MAVGKVCRGSQQSTQPPDDGPLHSSEHSAGSRIPRQLGQGQQTLGQGPGRAIPIRATKMSNDRLRSQDRKRFKEIYAAELALY